MTILLTTLTIIVLALLAILFFARVIVRASYIEGRALIVATVLGCGPAIDISAGQAGIAFGSWCHFFRRRPAKESKESAKISKETPVKRPPKSQRKFPLSVYVQIGKAFFLMAARVIARINYEGGKLEARPVFANPALAGMAYGWSQSLYGVFPALRETIDFVPGFVENDEYWSGYITFSIKNRQIVYVIGLFLVDLPLWKIIRHLFIRKVKHG